MQNGQTLTPPSTAVAPEEAPTQFVDFWRADGMTPITLLRDFEGTVAGQSMGYRIGNRIVRANNDLLGKLAGMPGQFAANWRILTDPDQRRLLARALVDDSLLNGERRKALFSIMLWGSLLLWVGVGVLIASVNRDALGTYQSVYGLFFYSLATSIFLPTPFEILLSNAVGTLGVVWTVAVAAIAKTVGSWIVLLMGDKANEGLDKLLEKNRTLRGLFHGLEKFAQKFGYFAVFVLFAIPFMSDTAPLFILAVLKMKKSIFLSVTFVAIVVRSLLFIYVF